MSMKNVLVVDDEPDICELLKLTLEQMDLAVATSGTLDHASSLLAKQSFDLCLTDLKLTDGSGLDLVKEIQNQSPETPVAVITAHGNMDTAITALKAGAFDFISKPIDLHQLRTIVGSALKLNQGNVDRRSRDTLLGESPEICEVRSKIAKIARTQAPTLIHGESGTGKELVASLIHQKSPRAEQPFVPINCGAIPHELMESEFFGHKKGSFSGAISDKTGLFQAADGGTLFLDEVAELPLTLQVKLLRAIQEKSIRPVGNEREIKVDVRIISASHKNLAELVEKGEFRQDLYYRINVIELDVPALRDRQGDIAYLASHLLVKLAERDGIEPPVIDENALQKLVNHHFPGNVRELENTLERALAWCDGKVIHSDDLSLPNQKPDSIPDQVKPELPVNVNLEEYLESIERRVISNALEHNRWNKTATAENLGISFRALRYRLKKLNLG
ncbi:MAG: sigma-54 dependent transcriptional regulator [Gammaproteobacteria bacterium]|nr:sigma-54 dependent transcriptional regulator [Gammaproteobacteria bacterium]